MIVLHQPVVRESGIRTDNISTHMASFPSNHYTIQGAPDGNFPFKKFPDITSDYEWAYEGIRPKSISEEHLRENPYAFMGLKKKEKFNHDNLAYYQYDLKNTAPTAEEFLIKNWQQQEGQSNGNVYPNDLSQQRGNNDTGVSLEAFQGAQTKEEGLNELLALLNTEQTKVSQEVPSKAKEERLQGIKKHKAKVQNGLGRIKVRPMSAGGGGGGGGGGDGDGESPPDGGGGGAHKRERFGRRAVDFPEDIPKNERGGDSHDSGPSGSPKHKVEENIDTIESKAEEKNNSESDDDDGYFQGQQLSDTDRSIVSHIERGMSTVMKTVQQLAGVVQGLTQTTEQLVADNSLGKSKRHDIPKNPPSKASTEAYFEQRHRELASVDTKAAVQEVRQEVQELKEEIKEAVDTIKEAMPTEPAKKPVRRGRSRTPGPPSQPIAERLTRETRLPAHLNDYEVDTSEIPSRPKGGRRKSK